MASLKRSLLATAVLSVLSTGVKADVDPDQVVLDKIDSGVCRSGYRPLDRYEAQEQKNALVSLMSPWQISSLQGGWVIMGTGYNSKIKHDEGKYRNTFCYPDSGLSEIPSQFSSLTRDFLNQQTVDVSELFKNGVLPTKGQVRFEASPQGFKLRYADSPAVDTMPAYFLGYNGQSSLIPAYIDIPKKAAEGTLLLNGTLTGGSVIVTDFDNTHYRVFHDARPGSSVLYSNTVMAVDYDDYRGQGISDDVAATYMLFKDGQWQLMLQRQKQIPNPDNPLLTNWVKRIGAKGEVWIQHPKSINQRARIEAFRQKRTLAQGRLLKYANALGLSIEQVPQDQDYQIGSSLMVNENAALMQWQDLRNKLKQKVDEELASLFKRKFVLLTMLDKEAGVQRQYLQAQINAINTTKEFYQQSYLNTIETSIDMDRLWLFLEKENREGILSATDFDESLKGNPNQRMVDRYNTQKMVFDNLKGQRGEDYQFGKANTETICLVIIVR
jgi:insecticidal toxin